MSWELDSILAEDEILSEAEDYMNDMGIDDPYPVDDDGNAFDDGYVTHISESEFRDYNQYVMDAYDNNRQPLPFGDWKEIR